MVNRILASLLYLTPFFLLPTAAVAENWFETATNNIRDGVNTVAPVVAPGATITIQIIQGKKPEDAIKDTALAGPRVIIDGAKAVAAADQTIENAVKNAVGLDLAKAIEIIRLPEKIERAVVITAAQMTLTAVDKGKVDAKEIATIPLAAALQQAIDLYKARAIQIPDTVKTLLTTTHTKETLDSARYTIDDNLGSLPGVINFMREKADDNFAVTVGNIIVFAKDPGLSNMHFWAHELQHTVQYRLLGVAAFAAKYSTNSSEMEAEAEEYGKKGEAEASTILTFLRLRQASAK